MKFSARCSTRPAAALLIAMLWLSGCAMGGSDARAPCPPMVQYNPADQADAAADQADAAAEVASLPADAGVVRMLSDYSVLRDQVRACAETQARERLSTEINGNAPPASQCVLSSGRAESVNSLQVRDHPYRQMEADIHSHTAAFTLAAGCTKDSNAQVFAFWWCRPTG